MRTWALFDTSWLAYRALHTIKGMEFGDLPTGVIYGFFEQMRAVCFNPRVATNQVALFFDSRGSVRRNDFPDYKRRRVEDRTPEELAEIAALHRQLDLLRREILPSIGFKTYRQSGLESDDVMAQASRQLMEDPAQPAVMITADQDLFQCITFIHHWFDPMRDLYVTWADLLNLKGVWPSEWGMVKCLSGCPGDGVPGIPGVGLTTAVQYLQKKLPAHHKKFQLIESAEGQAVVARNKKLVVLPRPETKPIDLTPPQYDVEAFFHWCKELGLNSYLDGARRRLWESFFAGLANQSRQVQRKRGQLR